MVTVTTSASASAFILSAFGQGYVGSVFADNGTFVPRDIKRTLFIGADSRSLTVGSEARGLVVPPYTTTLVVQAVDALIAAL